jgi:exodeoxyribonuclease VII large subunit
MGVDVIIVGRGGGSLEDLWPFNEETVARAIYQSEIPVISAVGHETDFTIADFVADLRAPTPSAAAELVVKDKREVSNSVRALTVRVENEMEQILETYRTEVVHLRKRLGDPRRRMESLLLRMDELGNRLQGLVSWTLKRKREAFLYRENSLSLRNPSRRIATWRTEISKTERRLDQSLRHTVELQRRRIEGISGKLDSLSPLAILKRGYSITRNLPSLRILRSVTQVKEGDRVEIRLHEGTLICGIEKTVGS